ncbi:MAG: flippase [Candidatus Glassbacteria bacterium]
MDKRLTILRNILSLQIAQILTKVISITFVAFAARYFGTRGFGQWSLVFLFLAFFGILSDFGLDTLTVRDVARDYSRSEKYLRNILGIKLISSIFISIMLILFVHAVGYRGEILGLFYAGIPILIFSTLSGPFVSVLKAKERMDITSGIEVIFGFLPSATGLLFIWLGFGIKLIMLVFAFWNGMRLLILMWIVRRHVPVFRPELDVVFCRKIFRDALFFLILGLIMMIHIRVDFFMLSKMVGDESVGIYAAPYKILEHIAMVGVLINVAMQPTISALYVRARQQLVLVYEKLQKVFLTIALPVFSVLIIYHREITLFFFGPQYQESIRVLFILSWACGILFFTTPMRVVILQSNLLSTFAPVVALNMLLNVILNFIFIPKYQHIGAAWISLNSTVIDLFIRIYFVRRVLMHKVDYLKMMPRPLLALSTMLVCIYLLGDFYIPVKVAVSLIPYLLMLKWLGVYDPEEIERFVREPLSKIVHYVLGRRSG